MNRIINLTNTNYDGANNRNIKYIVIHYVGAVSTAINNGNYFKDIYRGASAHYFIDENGIVQVVEDKNVAWHCNTKGIYKHYECRNTNSIGIEMCCKNNGNWYFEQATVDNTIELVKELMSKYNIPIENVIRHYDVTGKICPEPYVANEQAWLDFKSRLGQVVDNNEMLSEEEMKMVEQLRNEVQALRNEVAELRNKINGNVVISNVQRYTVTAMGVNVRQNPSLLARVVRLYNVNQHIFEILQDNGTWIRCNDGWIKKAFIKKI